MGQIHLIQRILWRSALVAGSLVALGALSHETERIWRDAGRTIIYSEGAQHWAGLALMCGLLAIVTTWNARPATKRLVVWLRASAALFLTSAVISGTHWLRLMDERSSAAGYEVQIAIGLPVTVTASITGFAIVLVLLMMTRQEENTAEHQTEPSSAQSNPN